MTLDFESLLTPEQRKQIIERRIAMYITEGYSQQINLKVAEEIGDEASAEQSKALLENISNAIAVLEISHAQVMDQIAASESSEPSAS